MNVLLVAPKHDDLLHAQAETDAVARALGVHYDDVLDGDVTVRELVGQLEGNQYDVLWFATHGTKGGIQLSDGPVPTGTLSPLVRASGAKLLVLNTCESISIGRRIHYELRIDVVCTIADVPDSSAYVTGALFARYLAHGVPPRVAYQYVASDDYKFFPDLVMASNWPQGSEQPNGRTNELEKKLERLILLIDGDEGLSVEGLRRQMERLTTDLQLVIARVDRLEVEGHQSRQKLSNGQLIAIMAVLVVVAALTFGTVYMMVIGY